MRRQTIPYLVVLIVLAVALAGCGGKKDATTPSSQSAPAATSAPQLVGDPVTGEKVYMSICVACHGPNAEGVAGLGKSMHPNDSQFISSKSDAELVEFIKVGRTPDDPLNTTGVGMPAKGGNPAITEQQLWDVVAWMRTLK